MGFFRVTCIPRMPPCELEYRGLSIWWICFSQKINFDSLQLLYITLHYAETKEKLSIGPLTSSQLWNGTGSWWQKIVSNRIDTLCSVHSVDFSNGLLAPLTNHRRFNFELPRVCISITWVPICRTLLTVKKFTPQVCKVWQIGGK